MKRLLYVCPVQSLEGKESSGAVPSSQAHWGVRTPRDRSSDRAAGPGMRWGLGRGRAQKSEWGQNSKQVISRLCASISPSKSHSED